MSYILALTLFDSQLFASPSYNVGKERGGSLLTLDANHSTPTSSLENTSRQNQLPGIITCTQFTLGAASPILGRPFCSIFRKWVRIGFGPRVSSFIFNILVGSVLKKHRASTRCRAGLGAAEPVL